MHAPLVRLSAIIIFALLAASQAEQAGKPEDKAKLVTRVYRVPSSMFFSTLSDSDGKKKDADSNPKELSVTADGEMRYDAWNFLAAQGVEKPAGSEAILLKDSNALVLTTSIEMQDLIHKIINFPNCFAVSQLLAVTASLWEYEDDQFADAGPGLRHFAELRQRAGDSLKLLDSQFITTKSAQIARAVRKHPDGTPAATAVPVRKPAKTAGNESNPQIKLDGQLDGARGSLLEVEPTILPSGEEVDLHIHYEARLRTAGAGQDIEVNLTTDLIVVNKRDVIPYCALAQNDRAPAQKGKAKRHAVVVGVRVIDLDDSTPEERAKKRELDDEQLIRKARAGLDSQKK